MNQPIPISAAAKTLEISASPLRRSERSGKLKLARTDGGQRRYNLSQLQPGQLTITPEREA
jgi:DNA-binding transcriptional MerR regulator